jgi:hypothetical protein
MVVNPPRNGGVSEKLRLKSFSTCLFLGMMLMMICNAVRLAAVAPAEGLAGEAIGGMAMNVVESAKGTSSETQSGGTVLLTGRHGTACYNNRRQKSVVLLCHISKWHYVFSPSPPPDPACGGVEEAENSLPFKGRARVGMGYHSNLTK